MCLRKGLATGGWDVVVGMLTTAIALREAGLLGLCRASCRSRDLLMLVLGANNSVNEQPKICLTGVN